MTHPSARWLALAGLLLLATAAVMAGSGAVRAQDDARDCWQQVDVEYEYWITTPDGPQALPLEDMNLTVREELVTLVQEDPNYDGGLVSALLTWTPPPARFCAGDEVVYDTSMVNLNPDPAQSDTIATLAYWPVIADDLSCTGGSEDSAELSELPRHEAAITNQCSAHPRGQEGVEPQFAFKVEYRVGDMYGVVSYIYAHQPASGPETEITEVYVTAATADDTPCDLSPVTTFDGTEERLTVVLSGRNLKAGKDYTAEWFREGASIYQMKDYTTSQDYEAGCLWLYVTSKAFDFTPGSYSVNFMYDGQLADTVEFVIQNPDEPQPTDDQAGTIIGEHYTAASTLPEEKPCKEPPVDTFTSDDSIIYVIQHVQNAKKDTPFWVEWYRNDVLLHTSTSYQTASDSSSTCIWVSVGPLSFEFSAGSYAALFYYDGERVSTTPFMILPGTGGLPHPTVATENLQGDVWPDLAAALDRAPPVIDMDSLRILTADDGMPAMYAYTFPPEEVLPGITLDRVFAYDVMSGNLVPWETLVFTNEGGSEVRFEHVERVPKFMAETVADLEFYLDPDEIIDADPILKWLVTLAGGAETRLEWWSLLSIGLATPDDPNDAIAAHLEVIEDQLTEIDIQRRAASCLRVTELEQASCLASIVARYPGQFTVDNCENFGDLNGDGYTNEIEAVYRLSCRGYVMQDGIECYALRGGTGPQGVQQCQRTVYASIRDQCPKAPGLERDRCLYDAVIKTGYAPGCDDISDQGVDLALACNAYAQDDPNYCLMIPNQAARETCCGLFVEDAARYEACMSAGDVPPTAAAPPADAAAPVGEVSSSGNPPPDEEREFEDYATWFPEDARHAQCQGLAAVLAEFGFTLQNVPQGTDFRCDFVVNDPNAAITQTLRLTMQPYISDAAAQADWEEDYGPSFIDYVNSGREHIGTGEAVLSGNRVAGEFVKSNGTYSVMLYERYLNFIVLIHHDGMPASSFGAADATLNYGQTLIMEERAKR